MPTRRRASGTRRQAGGRSDQRFVAATGGAEVCIDLERPTLRTCSIWSWHSGGDPLLVDKAAAIWCSTCT